MPRILKVYSANDDGEAAIRKSGKTIQKYDAFLLVEATSAQAKSLSRKYPVEDITSQYRLKIGDRTVNTAHPRITAEGSVRPHIAYTGTRRLAPGPHHYVVQFVGPIKENWLRRVRATGAKLRQPIGNFAYVVLARRAMLPKIAGLDVVRWLGELPHSDRIALPVLGKGRGSKHQRSRIRLGVYAVEIFASEDAEKIAAAARRLGFKVLSQNANAKLLIVRTSATGRTRKNLIHGLSAVHGVRIIRQRSVARMTNNVATRIMAKDLAAPAVGGLRLTGEGEIIGVCDGGFDTGDPDTIHPDFAGRIVAIKSYPITPDWTPRSLIRVAMTDRRI